MRRIKNITIVVLIISTFIQLSNIWNISVQEFFTSSYEVTVSDEYLKDILAPNKVYVKQGEDFHLAYNTKVNNATNRGVISLLSEIINNGEYVTTEKPMYELLHNVDVAYYYPNVVDEELLGSVIELKSNELNKIDLTFDSFYINEGDKEVYFYDSNLDKTITFNISNIENLNIPKNYTFNENILFTYNEVSYVNNGVVFTPNVIDGNYLSLSETNPYSENDEILASTVEAKINRFFKSPNEKWTIYGDDSYIFSGEDITVKYYSNNILEYKNNKDSNKKTDLATAYAIARSYIDLDEYVVNDLILKDFISSENSYIFYFNPIVNNTEVIFDNEYLDYYIEIEVTNGVVKQYKKYALNYNIEPNATNIVEPNASFFELEEHFESVELVYLQNMDELTVELYWAMSFNGDTVYTKAQLE